MNITTFLSIGLFLFLVSLLCSLPTVYEVLQGKLETVRSASPDIDWLYNTLRYESSLCGLIDWLEETALPAIERLNTALYGVIEFLRWQIRRLFLPRSLQRQFLMQWQSPKARYSFAVVYQRVVL